MSARVSVLALLSASFLSGCAATEVLSTVDDQPNYCSQLACMSMGDAIALRGESISARQTERESLTLTRETVVLTAEFTRGEESRCANESVPDERTKDHAVWRGCLAGAYGASGQSVFFVLTYEHGGSDVQLLQMPVSKLWFVDREPSVMVDGTYALRLGEAVQIRR